MQTPPSCTPPYPPPYPEVANLIPHRPPMQLLDAVLVCSDQALTASARISRSAPFCTARGVPGCVGLEYLGQAAAAFFSMLAFARPSQGGNPPPLLPGMLIASRSYSCAQGFFPLDCELRVEVSPTSAIGATGLVKFTGSITLAGAVSTFAKGDLSVYLPPA